MPKVSDIASAIECFAPRNIQESYDNSGLQIGSPDDNVSAALICLDITEDVVEEARHRECNIIISHHPLLFHGLKSITGRTSTERIAADAIRHGIAIYSAHTNLDAAQDGVSYEIARLLNLQDLTPLIVRDDNAAQGLGIIGRTPQPIPAIEFLRTIKKQFRCKVLRYSVQSPHLVIRKVAACGGAGADMIRTAIDAGADIYITGDIKYHNFTTYAPHILLADIGHYESELCTKEIIWRILRENLPEFPAYFSESEKNPIGYI